MECTDVPDICPDVDLTAGGEVTLKNKWPEETKNWTNKSLWFPMS